MDKKDMKLRKSILNGMYSFYDSGCGNGSFTASVKKIKKVNQPYDCDPKKDKLIKIISEYAEDEFGLQVCDDGLYFDNARYHLNVCRMQYNISVLFMHAAVKSVNLESTDNLIDDLNSLKDGLKDISKEIDKLQKKISKCSLKDFLSL